MKGFKIEVHICQTGIVEVRLLIRRKLFFWKRVISHLLTTREFAARYKSNAYIYLHLGLTKQQANVYLYDHTEQWQPAEQNL